MNDVNQNGLEACVRLLVLSLMEEVVTSFSLWHYDTPTKTKIKLNELCDKDDEQAYETLSFQSDPANNPTSNGIRLSTERDILAVE